jgi:hypothetical protein
LTFLQSNPTVGPTSFQFYISEAAVRGHQLPIRSRLSTLDGPAQTVVTAIFHCENWIAAKGAEPADWFYVAATARSLS